MSRPLREPSSRNRRFSALPALAALLTLAALERSSLAEPSAGARSAPTNEPLTPRIELRHDVWIDGGVTLGLAGALGGWVLIQNDVLPAQCRFCDGSSPGEVNAVDDAFRSWLKRPDTTPASTMSHVVAYGLAPVTQIGLGAVVAAADRRGDEALTNDLLVLEAVMSSVVVGEAVKIAVLRERPWVHAISDPDEKRAALETRDNLASFPSGHTNATFAMAAAGGTIATMRGYRLAPLVWIAGAMLGVGTAYLRMAADRHYFTDVLAGATIGTAMGIGVPLLFHRPIAARSGAAMRLLQTAHIATTDVPGGRVVSLGWAF